MSDRRRFPIALTVASAIALAILISLGVWQVKRLAWKTDMLTRIEALQHAAAQPIGPVLARAAKGQDVEFTRVAVECAGIGSAPFEQIYAVIDGQVVSRLVSACTLPPGGAFDHILVDRGFVPDSAAARPKVGPDATTMTVQGVLRLGDKKPARKGAPMAGEGTGAPVWYGRDAKAIAAALNAERTAPLFLMAETSTNPDFPALKPAPIPTDIPNNHLSYAITWFGLAAALVGVYAALLWRRLRG
jgi:surfeit locus 1 family protein